MINIYLSIETILIFITISLQVPVQYGSGKKVVNADIKLLIVFLLTITSLRDIEVAHQVIVMQPQQIFWK
ncbi:hypothetical protein BAS07_10035 [Elizabethkingia anophelis]|nr:hypothetical protein BBD30_11685 [Elizabethkingia anophelis]OPB63862.1 hypothetical protein BAS07_10035 [Elizabethkingia anophelis]